MFEEWTNIFHQSRRRNDQREHKHKAEDRDYFQGHFGIYHILKSIDNDDNLRCYKLCYVQELILKPKEYLTSDSKFIELYNFIL